MATQTSRTKLRRPQRGNLGDPNDIVNIAVDWNNNADILDDGIGMPTYTSTTHSNSPYDGKVEYESDTGLTAIWDAASNSWLKYPIDQFSKGNKGHAELAVSSADFTSASGETGPFLPITFTGESDRRYWYEFLTYLEQSVGTIPCNCSIRVRFASGTTVTTAGTQVGSDFTANLTATLGREIDFQKIYEFVPGINGNVTVGMFVIVNQASKTVHVEANANELLNTAQVRDVGI